MHLCYCKHSFSVFEDSLLLSAQLPNTKVSFRRSTHSKERCFLLSQESSFQQTLSVLLNRLPTQPSLVSFSEKSPHSTDFVLISPHSTDAQLQEKPLLNKGSLAPLNGVTKQTKADYALWEVSCVTLVKVLPESNLVFSSERSPHSTEPRLILRNRLPIRGIFLATLHSFYRSPYATVKKALTYLNVLC